MPESLSLPLPALPESLAPHLPLALLQIDHCRQPFCVFCLVVSRSVCSVLSSAVLCVPVLSSAVLCVPVLSSAVLCVPVLSSAVLCVPVLSSAVLYVPVLSSAVLCVLSCRQPFCVFCLVVIRSVCSCLVVSRSVCSCLQKAGTALLLVAVTLTSVSCFFRLRALHADNLLSRASLLRLCPPLPLSSSVDLQRIHRSHVARLSLIHI